MEDLPSVIRMLQASCRLFGRRPLSDDAIDLFFTAVEDIPWDEYEAAWQRSVRLFTHVPRPSELRALVNVARQRSAEPLALPAASLRPGEEFVCRDCEDTGWEKLSCTELWQCQACRRVKHHLYDHPYVRVCSCRQRNPVYKGNHPLPAAKLPEASELRE
jgi:hypothetical protein